MKALVHTALLVILVPAMAGAQVNAGEQKSDANLPFTMNKMATFNLPWRIAFLPDGRMLVTEKVGPVWLVTQRLPDLFGAGRGRIEPGAGAGAALCHGHRGEPRGSAGHLASDAEGQGGTIRRRDRLLS